MRFATDTLIELTTTNWMRNKIQTQESKIRRASYYLTIANCIMICTSIATFTEFLSDIHALASKFSFSHIQAELQSEIHACFSASYYDTG